MRYEGAGWMRSASQMVNDHRDQLRDGHGRRLIAEW